MKIKSLLISILLATSCYSYADSESKQAKLNELVKTSKKQNALLRFRAN